MDYGPTLMATYEVGDDGSNFAYKGIAVRLDAGPGGVSRGRHWSVFDHDTMRLAAAWTGEGFIDWNGINFNGRHQIHPKIVGRVQLANPVGPGWANPKTGSFSDPRLRGRDGRPYGPLPRSWAHFRGQYRHGDRWSSPTPSATPKSSRRRASKPGRSSPVFTRTFAIGPRSGHGVASRPPAGQGARLKILAPGNDAASTVAVLDATVVRDGTAVAEDAGVLAATSPPIPQAAWSNTADGDLRLTIPAGDNSLRFTLRVARLAKDVDAKALARSIKDGPAADLASLTRGGPARWPEVLKIADQGRPRRWAVRR